MSIKLNEFKEFMVLPSNLDCQAFSIEAETKEQANEMALQELGWMVIENEQVVLQQDENQMKLNLK